MKVICFVCQKELIINYDGLNCPITPSHLRINGILDEEIDTCFYNALINYHGQNFLIQASPRYHKLSIFSHELDFLFQTNFIPYSKISLKYINRILSLQSFI